MAVPVVLVDRGQRQQGDKKNQGGDMRIKSLVTTAVTTAAIALPGMAFAQQGGAIIVGEIAPLSGPAATVGARLSQVVKMWAEDTNKRGGINGRKIELIICNDEGNPVKAVTCARDLIAKGSVLLINDSLTASIRATLPIVANGPIMVVPSPNVAPAAGTNVFQVSPTDSHVTKSVANYMRANNIKKIGMVAATDSSGEVGIENAKAVFPPAGIELISARIDLRSTDASSQLASVASSDTKIIYSSYSGAGAATVVKSYFNLGLTQPLIISYANLSATFVGVVKDMLPPRLLGTSITALVPEVMTDAPAKARAVAFAKAYQERYGTRVDMINLLGKLSVDTVDAVLRNVKNPADPKAVKDYLQNNPIPSVQTIRFSKTSNIGLSEADMVIVELKNGIWVKADPVK
jgi:branched-chain amino acid transport system substrate-binding protein